MNDTLIRVLVLIVDVMFIALAFMISFALVYIPTESMEPTIRARSTHLAYCLPYWLGYGTVNRGDVIIFYSAAQDVFVCKRAIGLGGDCVEIRDGLVYVNGEKIDEYYLPEEGYTYSDRDVFHVPEGRLFLLGDNRNNSRDSRSWGYPFISESSVVARVLK